MERIVRLQPNKVDYLIPGGALINRFLGLPAGQTPCSQLWVASLTTSALQPGSETGLSRLWGSDLLLRDWLAQAPQARLGQQHYARHGLSLGMLLKLLDSDSRLLVQTHPNDEQAKRWFGLPSGKAEAWYVLDAQPDACLWVGFRPGVTAERFRRLIEQQDTHAILNCLHRLPVSAGDVVFLPPGTVHALGSGMLVAELQQPVDITLRAEYIRPDGSRLPPESLHSGAGMDALLECFCFDCLPFEQMCVRYLHPAAHRSGPVTRLIGPAQTPLFTMDEICLQGGTLPRRPDRLCVVLVVEGEGWLETDGRRLPLRRGDELFVPCGAGPFVYAAQNTLRVLECCPGQPG